MNSAELQIGKLQVRGAGQDGPAGRLRLSYLLNTADLQPAGLPPAAVLVVRRLADPLPGRIAPARQAVRIDATWEKAVRLALDELCRRAARPVRGVVAGNPDAVLFADEAELLACLLLARQSSIAATAWWIAALGRMAQSVPALATHLARKPHLVPAVFSYLAGWGKASVVLAHLPASQIRTLFNVVTTLYELPGLLPPDTIPDRSPALETAAPLFAEGRQTPDTGQQPAKSVRPPWVGLAPGSVPATLRPDQQALLGLCLVLQTRPAAVRTPAFRHQWHHWRRAIETPTSFPAELLEEPEQTVRPSKSTINFNRAKEPDYRPVEPTPAEQSPVESAPPEPARVVTARKIENRNGESETAAPAGSVPRPVESPDNPAAHTAKQTPSSPAELGARKKDAGEFLPKSPLPAVANEAETMAWATHGVATELGGVFYLLNVIRVLNLAAIPGPGAELFGAVGAWGVLELLGRALLGPVGGDHIADPLWRVLAELAGRPADTLPVLPAGLQSWWDERVRSIRRRLHQALRLAAEERLADALLLVPGRVFVTHSHVDLVMDLAAISMPVRRAGLDGNPGWLPAFGRIVTFHFR